MAETVAADLIEQGMAKYEAKAPYPEVIAAFEQALNGPKGEQGTAYTCLSWLHTLSGDAEKGFRTAKEALRLDRTNAQAHFNLVLAMLAGGKKGVREELQKAFNVTTHEALHEAEANLKDALERHPGFKPAEKLLGWLAHDHHEH